MAIRINIDNLTPEGKENLRKWTEKGFFRKEKTEGPVEEKIAETFTQEPEPEIKNSRELPAGLPDYVYKVDKSFKNATGDGRKLEMMKRMDEAVLEMREEGIIETKSKDGGVYTTINFPGEKPIHFLEPDLSKYSDDEYKISFDYRFGRANISKKEVKLGGMQGDIDGWKNEKLKNYVKQSGLHLPKQSSIEKFMQKLAGFVNQKYQLNIGEDGERIDLFCRAMNSIGCCSCFRCDAYTRLFPSNDNGGSTSFFLTDYLF